MERKEKYEMERPVLQRLKDEKVGTAISLLSAVHIAIAKVEADENGSRKLKDLNVEL